VGIMTPNLITRAVEVVGLAKLARILGVTYQAIRKWEAKGRLPRTDWTGETNYAAAIDEATGGEVSRSALLCITPIVGAGDTAPEPHQEAA
jgi:DNA-binding transcriptional regulator YdaS (Cro superfamily)